MNVVSVVGRIESGDDFHYLWLYEDQDSEDDFLKDLCRVLEFEIHGTLGCEFEEEEIEDLISEEPKRVLDEASVNYNKIVMQF